MSLTAMCKDCGYKPADAIRNFLINEDVLKFIITREIINDPGYLTRFENATEVRVGHFTHSNFEVLAGYVDYIVNCIKTNHARVRAEVLITEYGLTCLHIKKGGRSSGQGIYAHHDIALHFATWLNPAYGVYVNNDYQRLKNQEIEELTKRGVSWKFDRRDAALWYRLLEVTVREVIVPKIIDIPMEDLIMMAMEQRQAMADEVVMNTMIHISNLINVAVFNKTAQQWRDENPELEGNMRDYADEDELNLVSYLECCMIKVITEEPTSRWRKTVKSIAKKCRETGEYTILNTPLAGGLITNHEPESYDTRTITAENSAKEAFKNELLTGKVYYDEKDETFQDKEGFIRLGWKI